MSAVSAPDGQHQPSEASSSQQAVSHTEAHSQVETCDTQPGTCSASRLCDSVQAGVSKSQQAPQCGATSDCSSSRQAASDDKCKADSHPLPSSCDFPASETHSPAVAASGMESCAPAAAQKLPAVTQGSATAKQAAASSWAQSITTKPCREWSCNASGRQHASGKGDPNGSRDVAVARCCSSWQEAGSCQGTHCWRCYRAQGIHPEFVAFALPSWCYHGIAIRQLCKQPTEFVHVTFATWAQISAALGLQR